MATDVSTLSGAIVTKLQTVSELNGVYNYEVAQPTNGQYPFATVSIRNGTGVFGSNQRNIRKYTFTINVYQERTKAAMGSENAETVIRTLIDSILTAFDNDIRLGGACLWVEPLSYDANYIDREIGDTRIVQFQGVCTTSVPSLA